MRSHSCLNYHCGWWGGRFSSWKWLLGAGLGPCGVWPPWKGWPMFRCFVYGKRFLLCLLPYFKAELPWKNKLRSWLSFLYELEFLPLLPCTASLLHLVIAIILPRDESFSTRLTSEVWKSSPNSAEPVLGNSSFPNLAQLESHNSKIFVCRTWDISSEPFPTRHMMRWTSINTWDTGITSALSSASSVSVWRALRKTRGAIWRTAPWILLNSESTVVGKRVPKVLLYIYPLP